MYYCCVYICRVARSCCRVPRSTSYKMFNMPGGYMPGLNCSSSSQHGVKLHQHGVKLHEHARVKFIPKRFGCVFTVFTLDIYTYSLGSHFVPLLGEFKFLHLAFSNLSKWILRTVNK